MYIITENYESRFPWVGGTLDTCSSAHATVVHSSDNKPYALCYRE